MNPFVGCLSPSLSRCPFSRFPHAPLLNGLRLALLRALLWTLLWSPSVSPPVGHPVDPHAGPPVDPPVGPPPVVPSLWVLEVAGVVGGCWGLFAGFLSGS